MSSILCIPWFVLRLTGLDALREEPEGVDVLDGPDRYTIS